MSYNPFRMWSGNEDFNLGHRVPGAGCLQPTLFPDGADSGYRARLLGFSDRRIDLVCLVSENGGPRECRNLDLRSAKPALCQLSYRPTLKLFADTLAGQYLPLCFLVQALRYELSSTGTEIRGHVVKIVRRPTLRRLAGIRTQISGLSYPTLRRPPRRLGLEPRFTTTYSRVSSH